jgi:chloramphenicol-sensitive protein RarD
MPTSPPAAVATPESSSRRGIVAAAGANLWWGLVPLYFKALASVSPAEILAHRIVWSFVLLGAVEWRRLGSLGVSWRIVRTKRRALAGLALTSLLIGANWLIFVIAIHAGKTIEASVGYFVSPLVTAAIGMVVLGERSTKAQLAGMGLVAVGVGAYVYAQGGVPWVAIGLAGTFAAYGYVRKVLAVHPLTGLLWETTFLLPLAALWLGWQAAQGTLVFGDFAAAGGHGLFISFLLFLAGGITAAPLLLYAAALQRIDLRFVGMLQYLSPTCQFLVGWLVFREAFDVARAVSLGIIWAGLAYLAVLGLPKLMLKTVDVGDSRNGSCP